MSWEYSDRKYACPCGNGTYTETSGSNDWGQSSVTWKMDCASCELNYALYTYSYYKHGMHSEGHRWIKRRAYEKAMEFLEEAKILKNHSVELAKNRYLDVLVARFENSRKKTVWEVLHANIKWYKSLGTFYKHTKEMNKREYLGELFSDNHLEDVLKIANVKDKEIQEIITKKNNFKKEAENLLRGD